MAEVFEHRLVRGDPEAVARALAEGEWLERQAAVAGAGGEAVDAVLRAELGRGRVRVGVGKRVRLRVGPVEREGDRYLVPLSWEAAGFGGLFPVMEALVELRPAGRGQTSLVFWGRYDPPLGRVGDLTDRLIAHRVAEATVRTLLDRLAERLAGTPARGLRS